MLRNRSSFSPRTKLYHILLVAFLVLFPAYAFADPPPQPRCPQCQAKERGLKRISQELESTKKEWTETHNDINNESEYRRELTVKEKGREFLKDDPNIKKEINELREKLDRLPARKAQLPSLEAKIRELEGSKAKLEREIKECRAVCEEESRKSREITGYAKDAYGTARELDHPLGPAPRAPAQGCPEDCKIIAEMLGMLRADVEKKKEQMKAFEAARESAQKERKEKVGEITELESMGTYVSREQTPEGIRSREEYNKKLADARREAVRLYDKIQAYNRELYKTETGIKGLNIRIKELEDCEKKCQDPSRAHLKKALEPPGSYVVKPVPPAACPDCERITRSLEGIQAKIERNNVLLQRVQESMELINRDLEKKEDELEDWEAWSKYVSTEAKARAEYDRKTKELNKAIYELEELWYKRQSEIFKIGKENGKLEFIRKGLLKELDGCNEKCPVPGKTSCPAIPFEPLKIGPQLKYGSSASNTATDVAKNVLGGLLGGFFGGGKGGQPGSMGEAADRPPLDPNPFKQMNAFTDPGTGTAIRLAGKQTDTGMLLATSIEEGSGKPTIHSITLHRNDDCSIMMPDQYFLYELYLNWHLSVTWTRTTYVDNQVVKRESGGWSSGGSELIGRGLFAANQGGMGSIWEHFGFDRATGGPKTVGAEFKDLAKGSSTKFPDRAVVHITRPDQDPVTTVPFIFSLSQKPDGMLDLKHMPVYVPPKLVPTEN